MLTITATCLSHPKHIPSGGCSANSRALKACLAGGGLCINTRMGQEKNSFENRIKQIRQDCIDATAERQRLERLSYFQAVWTPLIDHVQALADRYVPDDVRLRAVFEIDSRNTLNLTLIIEERAPLHGHIAESGWNRVGDLHFYRKDHGLLTDMILGTVRLKDIFSRDPAARFSLACLSSSDRDPVMEKTLIYPDRMNEAKAVLEYWLARHIALHFNPEQLNPAAQSEMTVRPHKEAHKGAGQSGSLSL